MTGPDPRRGSRTRSQRSDLRERGVIVLLSVLLVVVVAAIGWNLTSSTTGARPTPATQVSTPPAREHSASDSSRAADHEQLDSSVDTGETVTQYQRALEESPLYDHPAPRLTACPEPVVVDTREQYEAAVIAQVTCLHQAWSPVLAELGLSQDRPDVVFFRGSGTDSACGALDAPAFYCSLEGGTLHFGDGHLEMAREWSHSINEMVNHEYGHHLQAVAGMTLARTRLGDTVELERRSELQAICWSAMMTVHNDAVQLDRAARAGWQNRLETMLADERHGTQESLIRWGQRGLDARSIGDCNTWTVSEKEVA
ncbi:hypothetical protein EII34_05240 [Arachnia propionica]|uniref:Neutral zinc metallopeptidase n=1 Tax=Arachnia propionica TaxID=1750 RepID=A0A3P1T9M7_9ACTN|nr:neutral zinc metallopeptidase [Arachnia propionica]RRD06089.1 hypothetical protein EII34_05240 [Arachnia propionica]